MSVTRRVPAMTRGQFFDWAEAQEERYEFDGFEPVAMTGGNINHDVITGNIHRALHARLRGGSCRPLGPNAGIATVGDTVRYPDQIVTCARAAGTAHLVPGVVVVFEVLSPSSGRIDRIVKVREYAAVASILRYVIVESADVGLTVLERADGDQKWTATTLTGEDALSLPEVEIEVAVAALYEGIDLPDLASGPLPLEVNLR